MTADTSKTTQAVQGHVRGPTQGHVRSPVRVRSAGPIAAEVGASPDGAIAWRRGYLEDEVAMSRRLDEIQSRFRRSRLASRCARAVLGAMSDTVQVEAVMGEGLEATCRMDGAPALVVTSTTGGWRLAATVAADAMAVEVTAVDGEGGSDPLPSDARGRVEVEAFHRQDAHDPQAVVAFTIDTRVDLRGGGASHARHEVEGMPEELGARLLALAFQEVVPVLAAWRETEASGGRGREAALAATSGVGAAAGSAAAAVGPATGGRGATPGGEARPTRTRVALYDVAEVAKALDATSDETDGVDAPPRPTSVGEDAARARLEALASLGPEGGMRELVHGDAAMMARLERAAARAPHMRELTDLLRRHIAASAATGTPLRLPPLLVLGPAGNGKSWLLRVACSIMGVPFRRTQMNVTSLSEGWAGLSPVWKGAKEGAVAKALLQERVANPLIVVDEFDKGSAHSHNADPYRAFYTLLERENASAFPDEFLGFPMDASHVMWIMTANSLDPLPGPILDRLRVVSVPAIAPAEMVAIVRSIHDDLAGAFGGTWFEPEMPRELEGALCERSPRQAKAALEEAMTRAAADGRHRPRLDDLPAPSAPGRVYGFTS